MWQARVVNEAWIRCVASQKNGAYAKAFSRPKQTTDIMCASYVMRYEHDISVVYRFDF